MLAQDQVGCSIEGGLHPLTDGHLRLLDPSQHAQDVHRILTASHRAWAETGAAHRLSDTSCPHAISRRTRA